MNTLKTKKPCKKSDVEIAIHFGISLKELKIFMNNGK